MCAQEGEDQLLRMLIDAGADVNVCVREPNVHALVAAVKRNASRCVRLLLDAGVDVQVVANSDEDPVYHCIEANDTDSLMMLIGALLVTCKTIRLDHRPRFQLHRHSYLLRW
jgi:hypothetical protein